MSPYHASKSPALRLRSTHRSCPRCYFVPRVEVTAAIASRQAEKRKYIYNSPIMTRPSQSRTTIALLRLYVWSRAWWCNITSRILGDKLANCARVSLGAPTLSPAMGKNHFTPAGHQKGKVVASFLSVPASRLALIAEYHSVINNLLDARYDSKLPSCYR